MTGRIPDTWNQLNRIVYIDLSNNAFTGNLAGKFNNSMFLASLLVQNNALTGKIDDSLLSVRAASVQSLDFSSNFFTGMVLVLIHMLANIIQLIV